MWEKLTDIAAARDTLWFLTGDFNEIIDNSEKSGGKERPGSFLSSCNFFDLRHSGDFLTWRESDIHTLSIPDWIGPWSTSVGLINTQLAGACISPLKSQIIGRSSPLSTLLSTLLGRNAAAVSDMTGYYAITRKYVHIKIVSLLK